MDSDTLGELRWRGLVHDVSEGAAEALASGRRTLYAGFDPTADSLHVGSLMPLMGLARLQRLGHRPIGLMGGGTGLIGDPSGKSRERTLLTREEVRQNLTGIRVQMERFLDFGAGEGGALLVDNADWLCDVGLMEFLRDVGKHFGVGAMLAKESVKRRIGSDEGISYTEFTYMLLQAYDFLVLHDRHGCTLQIGGSDQWGNITAGMELIRKLRSARTHGVTFPLVTTASGAKFGKTEAGTVWLDAKRTSPFRFHQYWLNTDDRDVIAHLKAFTWLERTAIEDLEQELATHPEKRAAQRVLADELTRMLHGEEARARAEQASRVLFSGDVTGLGADELLEVFEDVPSVELAADELRAGISVADLMVRAGAAGSKSEVRRLVKGGGASLNGVRLADGDARVTLAETVEGRVLTLRKGRKSWFLVRVGS